MADLIIMPKLGFDMAEGTLINWMKQEGDVVEKGEILAEIETDKATVEVESMFAGTVRKHLVTAGAIVPVNTPIAVVGASDENIDFDSLVAQTGGDSTQANAPEPETKPVTEPAPPATPAAPPPAATSSTSNGNLPGGVKASPLARNIAQDNNIALQNVTGTGPGGRIVKRDVEDYIANPPAAAPEPASAPASSPSGPSFTLPPIGGVEFTAPADNHVPLTRLRQAIGRRMVQSKLEQPAFYVTYEYNIDPLMAMRKKINAALDSSGEKISVNDFIIKASALTLREYPNLNAKLEGDQVVQMGHVNVGVAVAVPNGLMTVVVHDADRKSLRQISGEVKEKAKRARAGKVHPDDVSGSTFSTSNLGMFGVENFIAILNPPEAAILAIGSGRNIPVVTGDEIKPGWRMKATVSVDHRVSDGAEGAEFMQALAKYIENPISLML